ncbi:hypothetical protein D5073_08355 [Pectobacterium versatile]|nr:hypothetical protein D5073_08355 [Pectobacterium versatile]RJL62683.1 hypothetical protein D5076_02405 [Pectobacterium versatile]RJL64080.1 hypothetical protein D5080_09120 [Pectobacterium versatile]
MRWQSSASQITGLNSRYTLRGASILCRLSLTLFSCSYMDEKPHATYSKNSLLQAREYNINTGAQTTYQGMTTTYSVMDELVRAASKARIL